jgi:hypothetical protein
MPGVLKFYSPYYQFSNNVVDYFTSQHKKICAFILVWIVLINSLRRINKISPLISFWSPLPYQQTFIFVRVLLSELIAVYICAQSHIWCSAFYKGFSGCCNSFLFCVTIKTVPSTGLTILLLFIWSGIVQLRESGNVSLAIPFCNCKTRFCCGVLLFNNPIEHYIIVCFVVAALDLTIFNSVIFCFCRLNLFFYCCNCVAISGCVLNTAWIEASTVSFLNKVYVSHANKLILLKLDPSSISNLTRLPVLDGIIILADSKVPVASNSRWFPQA